MSRRARKRRKTFPEELFGVDWARRLRVGIPVSAAALLAIGAATFAIWSQTVGKIVMAIGLWIGLMWFLLRRGDPDGALASVRRARPRLIVLGCVLVAAGIALYVTVDQDVGLLFVVFGGMALAVNLLTVKQEPLAGPIDGPMYGDTPPYGH